MWSQSKGFTAWFRLELDSVAIGFAGRHLGFGFLFAQEHLWFALLLLLLHFFFSFMFLHFFICVPEAEVCAAFMVIMVEKQR